MINRKIVIVEQNNNTCHIYIPYGSYFYGESHDIDLVPINGVSSVLAQEIQSAYPAATWQSLGQYRKEVERSLPSTLGDDIPMDILRAEGSGNQDFSVLAYACIEEEFPGLLDLLGVEPPSREAILRASASWIERLSRVLFLRAWNVRKLAFALAQHWCLRCHGVFLDTKHKIEDWAAPTASLVRFGGDLDKKTIEILRTELDNEVGVKLFDGLFADGYKSVDGLDVSDLIDEHVRGRMTSLLVIEMGADEFLINICVDESGCCVSYAHSVVSRPQGLGKPERIYVKRDICEMHDAVEYIYGWPSGI